MTAKRAPRLFHFTSLQGWQDGIDPSGVIRAHSDSRIDMFKPHKGPDVVWLTEQRRPIQYWQEHTTDERLDKSRIRIEVSVDGARRWVNWPPARFITPLWKDALIAACGGHERVYKFWVTTHDIPRNQWLQVVDTLDNYTIWTPAEL